MHLYLTNLEFQLDFYNNFLIDNNPKAISKEMERLGN